MEKPKLQEPIAEKPAVEGEDKPVVEAAKESEFIDDKRLYVMNLSYQVTREELQELFGKYGEIADIEIPFRKGGRGTPLGIAFVKFSESEAAIGAFAELDKQFYQGRKLHIKPAEKKPPKPDVPEFEPRHHDEFRSTYQQHKEKILKTNFDDETNWNYLYINQDTVATSMAKQLGVEKGDFLDKTTNESMAVKLASSETLIISQTKEWLKTNCDLDFDKIERANCKRSHTVILVKNIPATTKEAELRELFERYGSLERMLVGPFNTLAIVEYHKAS